MTTKRLCLKPIEAVRLPRWAILGRGVFLGETHSSAMAAFLRSEGFCVPQIGIRWEDWVRIAMEDATQ